MQLRTLVRRCAAGLLCIVLSPASALCQSAATSQPAGAIGGFDPAGTRNGSPTRLHDEVLWNDLLQTSSTGRMRLNLRDGSLLSLGSDTQLRVVQHDPVAQQTSMELLFGRLRSQVVKLTQPNSKFEVRTPHSVIGVIGTDFLLVVSADRTTVIVFSGVVQVTPLTAAGVPNTVQQVHVNSGQQVDVTNAGVSAAQPIAQSMIRSLMQQTAVSHAGLGGAVAVQATTSVLRSALIAVASVAAGTVAGVTAANAVHNSTPVRNAPPGPHIPPQ